MKVVEDNEFAVFYKYEKIILPISSTNNREELCRKYEIILWDEDNELDYAKKFISINITDDNKYDIQFFNGSILSCFYYELKGKIRYENNFFFLLFSFINVFKKNFFFLEK